MSRAVTADHVLFDECIDAFRRQDKKYVPLLDGKSGSYLLTSFELQESWELPYCAVHPSVRVHLPGAASAFIALTTPIGVVRTIPTCTVLHSPPLFLLLLESSVSQRATTILIGVRNCGVRIFSNWR